ncbi:hypothetical protein FKM82_012060 [Ascaphus truei]
MPSKYLLELSPISPISLLLFLLLLLLCSNSYFFCSSLPFERRESHTSSATHQERNAGLLTDAQRRIQSWIAATDLSDFFLLEPNFADWHFRSSWVALLLEKLFMRHAMLFTMHPNNTYAISHRRKLEYCGYRIL